MTISPMEAGETVLSYTGGLLDRASDRRTDPDWVEATLAAPGARLVPLWRDKCLVSAEPAPVVLVAAEAAALLAITGNALFLGLDHGTGVFAADLSSLEEARAVVLAGAEGVLDVRALVGALSPADAAMLAYARGLLHWNRHERFCGSCGSATESRNGGHMRVCAGARCARSVFPRVEPAVIMLVELTATPQGACWPGTRAPRWAGIPRWRDSSRSARASRTQFGARWPRRPECRSGR